MSKWTMENNERILFNGEPKIAVITPYFYIIIDPNNSKYPKAVFIGKKMSQIFEAIKQATINNSISGLFALNNLQVFVDNETFLSLFEEIEGYMLYQSSSHPLGRGRGKSLVRDNFTVTCSFGPFAICRNADIPEWVKIIDNALFWEFVDTGKVNEISNLDQLKKMFTKT